MSGRVETCRLFDLYMMKDQLSAQASEFFFLSDIVSFDSEHTADAQNSPHLCFLEEEMAFPGEDGVWVARFYPLC